MGELSAEPAEQSERPGRCRSKVLYVWTQKSLPGGRVRVHRRKAADHPKTVAGLDAREGGNREPDHSPRRSNRSGGLDGLHHNLDESRRAPSLSRVHSADELDSLGRRLGPGYQRGGECSRGS